VSGEQFALSDAVERLREVRRTAEGGDLVTISAADPLNLTGILTSDERVRASGGRSWIVYRAGAPVAVTERRNAPAVHGHVTRPTQPAPGQFRPMRKGELV
jgi:hypothetical protein